MTRRFRLSMRSPEAIATELFFLAAKAKDALERRRRQMIRSAVGQARLQRDRQHNRERGISPKLFRRRQAEIAAMAAAA